MCNWKRFLTGSEQTGKQKPERGSGRNRNLKIGGNSGMDRVWIDEPGRMRQSGKAPFPGNKWPDLEHSPHICAFRFLTLQS